MTWSRPTSSCRRACAPATFWFSVTRELTIGACLMSLAEGKIEFDETDFADTSAAMQKWQHFPASTISHHGTPCCQIAREWIISTDYSQLNAGNPLTGPRWIRQKYTRGAGTGPR